jgi:hypothetical protein
MQPTPLYENRSAQSQIVSQAQGCRYAADVVLRGASAQHAAQTVTQGGLNADPKQAVTATSTGMSRTTIECAAVLLLVTAGMAGACGEDGALAENGNAGAQAPSAGSAGVSTPAANNVPSMTPTLQAPQVPSGTAAGSPADQGSATMGAMNGTTPTTPPPAAGTSGSGPAADPTSGAAGMPAAAAGSMSTGMCQDSCAVSAGVEWLCKKRFMYGVNYAWHTFAADFGGNQAWSQPGIAAEPAVEAELRTMAEHGINVVRWWLWPDFRGDGVAFDASDTPTGLGGTALADLNRALELADTFDLYLMLTPFSFDNFRPTRMEAELRVRGMKPIATDDTKRRALIENVVAPLARAVEASPFKDRMIAWDIINEPEWAVTGPSMHGGDPEFDPMDELEPLTHAQMETFLRDVNTSLRENSSALITVGGTAIKWAHAWSKLDLDFHQFHMYDWVNMYWPYSKSPTDYGLTDKPVVMGEFPINGLTGVSYSELLESWFSNGYAGALGWAFTDTMFNSGDYSAVKAFADAHACETRY